MAQGLEVGLGLKVTGSTISKKNVGGVSEETAFSIPSATKVP